MFFFNKKVHFLVSELYIYRNAQCNSKYLDENSCIKIIICPKMFLSC